LERRLPVGAALVHALTVQAKHFALPSSGLHSIRHRQLDHLERRHQVKPSIDARHRRRCQRPRLDVPRKRMCRQCSAAHLLDIATSCCLPSDLPCTAARSVAVPSKAEAQNGGGGPSVATGYRSTC
jgi:hypothetical protein